MMGKPDALDRLAQAMVGLVALFALGNGAFMLVDPLGWYNTVETVRFSGPPNGHFIRDIGLAFLSSGALLAYAVPNLTLRWPAALAGAGWLLAHGGLHVWEVSQGICAPGIFWQDAPGVIGLPLLALAGVVLMAARGRIAPGGLPKALYLRAARRFMGSGPSYLPDLAAAPGFATEKFQHFIAVSIHRHAASADLIGMVRIGAAMAEDCGPCTLITAHGAVADGVSRELVNAALGGRLPAGDLAQALAFGRAIATCDPDAQMLGDALEARFGRIVRTECALAAAMVRTYPAFKRGLGLATSCSAVALKV